MNCAYVNIGSNQGDRAAFLAGAVALIEATIAQSPVNRSDIVESDPWGYDSTSPYLNQGITFMTALPPHQLLHALLDIQNSISRQPHRKPDGTYADRPIDIDLIAVDSLVIDTPELTLPHPGMHLRPFVLQPMAQLLPSWTHPTIKLTATQLLKAQQCNNGNNLRTFVH